MECTANQVQKGRRQGHQHGCGTGASVITAQGAEAPRGPQTMPSNCGAGEDSRESLESKEIKPVNLKGYQS